MVRTGYFDFASDHSSGGWAKLPGAAGKAGHLRLFLLRPTILRADPGSGLWIWGRSESQLDSGPIAYMSSVHWSLKRALPKRQLISRTLLTLLVLWGRATSWAETADQYETLGFGTGFLVSSNGLIATCYHVVDEADAVQVDYKGQIFNAKTICINPGNDLAILKIEGGFPFFCIEKSETVKLGDDVYTIGFPLGPGLGIEPRLTTGTVSSLSGKKDDPAFYQISVPIQPGNSGGPLIAADGAVIGVITSSIKVEKFMIFDGFLPQNINWAVKSEYLEMLLKTALEKTSGKTSQDRAVATARSYSKEESVQRVVRIISKVKKNGAAKTAVVNRGVNPAALQPWEEVLNAALAREGLIQAVQLINEDDPFENYDEIKGKLPPEFRHWMDAWYANTYAGWLARGGGWVPGNLRGNPTPFEQQFRALKKEASQQNQVYLRGWIEALSYLKFTKSKVQAKGYELLVEHYPGEWKESISNKEHGAMLDQIYEKSKKDALHKNIDKVGKIIISDTVGFSHTDPTISNDRLLITRTYKGLIEPLSKDDKETTYLYISLVTKEPYLIKIPKPEMGSP